MQLTNFNTKTLYEVCINDAKITCGATLHMQKLSKTGVLFLLLVHIYAHSQLDDLHVNNILSEWKATLH
jgi:hypothetical protein